MQPLKSAITTVTEERVSLSAISIRAIADLGNFNRFATGAKVVGGGEMEIPGGRYAGMRSFHSLVALSSLDYRVSVKNTVRFVCDLPVDSCSILREGQEDCNGGTEPCTY